MAYNIIMVQAKLIELYKLLSQIIMLVVVGKKQNSIIYRL